MSLVCGNFSKREDEDFNIRDLFRIRTDDDVRECPPLYDSLFFVIDQLDVQHKRMFLKFVTGVDRLPLPMSETIKIDSPFMCFSDEEHKMNLIRLPTAHTCFNTMEMPNYVASMLELEHDGAMSMEELDDPETFLITLREHVRKKIMLAIQNTEGSGYGLDEGVRHRDEELIDDGGGGGGGGGGGASSTQEPSTTVTIVRTEKVVDGREKQQKDQKDQKDQKEVKEETPREETPRQDEDSDDSYGIPGLSDDDDSDLDDLFDGFD